MPELPEVETVVRTLEYQLGNVGIASCEVLYPNIIDNVEVNAFCELLKNEKFTSYSRRGKYLIFTLDTKVLVCHLRMEGKFYIQDIQEEINKLLEENNDNFEFKASWGCDLQTEHERYLTEQIFKRPVFVTDYPKDIKAFYMKMNDDNKTVAAVDCLVPGIGEIIGGSQREDNYDKLVARMVEMGLNPEEYQFYLDLRKYGSTRHAGFGLGFERCVMYLTGMSNIRDVIPFPRTVNNCEL